MSDSNQKDSSLLYQILPFAAAAPSPLNIQPWRISLLSSTQAELFIDSTRVLRNLDPEYRQVMISLGAFLENLDLAARHVGFTADIVYFPSGWPEPRLDLEAPVARIELISDGNVPSDPLFAHIMNRRSDRSTYNRKAISPGNFGILSGSFDSGPAPISLGYTTSRDLKSEIAGYLVKAVEVELSDTARFSEALTHMPFPANGNQCPQTGLSMDQIGLSPVFGLYTRIMGSLLAGPGKDRFVKRTILSLARKQAQSSAAFGWIASREDHRITQIRAGRIYERVHLSATSIGLSFQPMTQITRDYENMQDLQKPFRELLGIPETHAIQMFFRLGFSGRKHAVAHRLSVEELVH